LHWGARPDIPARFLQQCAEFDCKGDLGDRTQIIFVNKPRRREEREGR
jgi:cobyrinic acid a,c-diamide synthase